MGNFLLARLAACSEKYILLLAATTFVPLFFALTIFSE